MTAFNVAEDSSSSREPNSTLFDSSVFEANLFSFLVESVLPLPITQGDRNLQPVYPANYGIWNALLAEVFRTTGVSLDAWQATSELLCRCLINAENLGKALKLAAHFSNQGGQLQVVASGSEVLLIPESDASYPIQILQLAAYLKLISWLIDEPIPVARVGVNGNTQSRSTRSIELLFNCDPQFSDRNAIAIDSAMLHRPLVRIYSDLRSILALPTLALIPWPSGKSIANIVTQLIAKAISRHGHAPALDEIAFQLHRSSSSLRRQLHQEGTSFQMIKDTWRQEQAEHLLQNPANTLDYIASRLGFECTSVFSRAFKAWTGIAPSRFRQAL